MVISRSLSLELHGSVVLTPRMGAQGVTLAVNGSTCESRVRFLGVGSAGRARLLDDLENYHYRPLA